METQKSLFQIICEKNPFYSKLNHWVENCLILIIAYVLSTETLSAANPRVNPPGRDGGFFMYVGKALRSGATLYADIWDSKGPLIFWINAIGIGDNFSRWGVFLIELIFWASSLIIAYGIIKKQYGIMPALGTILIGSTLLKLVVGPGNSTEEYSLLFTWIAIASLVLLTTNHNKTFWPFFLMGATIVLNFLLRANNIGTQAVIILIAFIYVFINRKGIVIWQTFLFLIIGVLTVAIPTVLYFTVHGTFLAMLDASILYNFSYSTATGKSFSNSLGPAINVFKRWFFILFILWIFGIKNFVHGLKEKEFNPVLCLTIFSFPIEALMSSISGRGFTHYFICWIPAFMLLVAYGLSVIQIKVIREDFRNRFEIRNSYLILVMLSLIILGNSYAPVYHTTKYFIASLLRPNTNREYIDPVSSIVNSLTGETDKVLVFAGQAGINIMSHRDSINGALFYPAINNSSIGLEVQNNFFENLQKERPSLILDGHSMYPEQIPAIDPLIRKTQRFVVSFSENLDQVMEWINENYERYDESNGYIIYRLRSLSQ